MHIGFCNFQTLSNACSKHTWKKNNKKDLFLFHIQFSNKIETYTASPQKIPEAQPLSSTKEAVQMLLSSSKKIYIILYGTKKIYEN